MKFVYGILIGTLHISLLNASWHSPFKWLHFRPVRSQETVKKQSPFKTEKKLSTVEQTLEEKKNNIITYCAENSKESERLSTEITILKERLNHVRNHEADFLNKKLSLTSQTYQVLIEREQVCKEIEGFYSQLTVLVKEQKANPTYTHLLLPDKTTYGYEEFAHLNGHMVTLSTNLTELERTRQSLVDDVSKRKKALGGLQEELKEKKKRQESFSSQRTGENAEFTQQEQSELIDNELRLITLKKELAELRLQESEAQLALVEFNIVVSQEQLEVLHNEYNRIKRHFNVDAHYVKQKKDALEQKRQFSVELRDRLYDKIRFVANQKEDIRKKIEILLENYAISAPEVTQIREWNKEPKTIIEWLAVCNLGSLFIQENVFDAEKDYLESLVELEKSKFEQNKVNVDIINSWHKITQRNLRIDSEEYINREIKTYELSAAEIHSDIRALTDKRSQTINIVQRLNHILDKVKTLHATLRSQRNYMFKNSMPQFNQCMVLLSEVEDNVRKYIDVTAKLIENYSSTLATDAETVKKIEGIITELNAKGFWRRSEQSIEWQELRNFFPDLKQFFIDVGRRFQEYTQKSALQETVKGVLTMRFLGTWLFRLIIFALLFLLMVTLLDRVVLYFSHQEMRVGNRFKTLSLYIGLILKTIHKHSVSFYIWLILLISIKVGFIEDSFIAILFYLFSIPYLMYIASQCMREFFAISSAKGDLFLTHSYKKRFMYVISPLIYATIIIFFLREAYMLGGYPMSHVPTILLAFNFILLQIALISLIGKEQILSIIPDDTPLWEWVEEHVDRYYYPLLLGIIAIIIMSNPYVGYGRQVLYILSRLLLTILLIPLFSWLHNKIKQTSSDLFFYYTQGEAIKERFVTGKTWYGVFVIISFIFFVIAGIVIGASIWGYSIYIDDIKSWLHHELYSPGIDEATGKPIIVSIFSIFLVLWYVLSGIAVTYIVSYFVLRRIFDPLLIGGGVQNTIVTITRYIIVIAALLMGLQSAGLDSMATKFFVILAGLSVAFREPISDFLSYFIILVQRPIKIGDLIMLDEEIKGVVRQITPRSTILRRRNSVTVIVPNSHIITKVWANWNYSPTFFAFDDIFITVPYSADPTQIMQLLKSVLEANINILRSPAPIIWLHNFVDNGYQFLVRGYLTADKVLDQWEIASQVRLEIVRVLRERGIEVASPTRIIRMMEKNNIL